MRFFRRTKGGTPHAFPRTEATSPSGDVACLSCAGSYWAEQIAAFCWIRAVAAAVMVHPPPPGVVEAHPPPPGDGEGTGVGEGSGGGWEPQSLGGLVPWIACPADPGPCNSLFWPQP